MKGYNMRLKWIISLLISTPLMAEQVIGKAYVGDELEYTENRRETSGRDYTSQYTDSNDKLFATKTVSYPSDHPWAPLFTLEDIRHDYKLQVTSGGKGIKVYLKQDGDVKTGTFPVNSEAIWDAGIHYFIVDNWDKLKASQTRSVFIPELMRFIDFDFKRDQQNKVEMKISNTLLSWFVDPIIIQYSPEAIMKKYDGISDIQDAKQKQLSVVIYYSYPEAK
jgi:hypothetical protein